ncbi:MAG TPA: glycine--tRNA ligase subunit beta [Candidatus Cybelea sp.]|nr:glycine--tRNA ligase subunit beta [Candidatus Cybelea sp.]
MAELLLELLSEEIPARMQTRAADDLKRLVGEALLGAGLKFSSARAFSTPRRLTLVVEGLPEAQPDVTEERKGPRVGSPEKAVEGFLKAAGLAEVAAAEQRDTGKGVFYFAVVHKKGRASAAVLSEILPSAVLALPWPKAMSWGSNELRWVRPLQSVLCLFAGKTLPIKIGHIASGDVTRGHRFMGAGSIRVSDFGDYQAKLRANYVMLDAAERRQSIANDVTLAAAAENLTLVEDAGLLDEVTGLVEWPVVLVGSIDTAFMDVPREVLTTAMRAHQKYFSLQTKDGKLAPRFVLVANMMADDGGKQIVAGNQTVLRARLADAKFFWDQDRKTSLESRVRALKDIVFHAKLGTLAEKVERMEQLSRPIAEHVPGADARHAQRAARLAKADLTSGMVGEFPELQGVMGRYYARNDGEPADVAEAIAEHYSPLGPNDRCPTAPTSIVAALADKLDTLAGFFAADEKPTGSKDPFALRRAALGVIRIVLENKLRLPLARVFDKAYDLHAANLGLAGKSPTADLLEFFADRLKVHLREQGVRHDLVSAVFALGGEDDLVRLLSRVDALKAFLGSDDGGNLLVAYRRAANILRIEEKKDDRKFADQPDPALIRLPEESKLFERLNEVAGLAEAALAHEEFTVAAQAQATLRKPVDDFFDKVTVNADDAALRVNRLCLLARIRGELDRIADFSKIEG